MGIKSDFARKQARLAPPLAAARLLDLCMFSTGGHDRNRNFLGKDSCRACSLAT
jgi:hypothetical protein